MKLYINSGPNSAVFSCSSKEEGIAKFIKKFNISNVTNLAIVTCEFGFRDYDEEDKQQERLYLNVS